MLDLGNHSRLVPIFRPHGAGDLFALLVDQDGRRRAQNAQGVEHLGGGVDVDRQVADEVIVVKAFHGIDAALVHRKRHDSEVFAAKQLLQFVQRGHFVDAGRAPGRPDIEQHDLALEIRQGHVLALRVFESDLRQRQLVRCGVGGKGESRRPGSGRAGGAEHDCGAGAAQKNGKRLHETAPTNEMTTPSAAADADIPRSSRRRRGRGE